MPGKSRPGRAKRSARHKKERGATVEIAPSPVADDKPAPVVVASSESVSRPAVKLTPARYPYIVAELRRIVILAGIMLAILLVLAQVLS